MRDQPLAPIAAHERSRHPRLVELPEETGDPRAQRDTFRGLADPLLGARAASPSTSTRSAYGSNPPTVPIAADHVGSVSS